MFLRRHSIFIALLFCAAVAVADKREDWQPVTSQDLQIKSVPGDARAGAIQLYYMDSIDDVEHSEFLYQRIKILNDKGLKYADVEIPVIPGTTIRALKARTIHPDGNIIDFTGKPFEKMLVKTKGLKVLAKTFTLPDVTTGSIVEFKYRIERDDYGITDNEWIVQHDLYTVKASYRMRAYQGRMTTAKGEEGSAQVSAVFSQMPGSLRPNLNGQTYEMEAENIPAFESENYMPPEDWYKPHVRFFYGVSHAVLPERFWDDFGRQRYAQVEKFIGNSGDVRDAAAQAIVNETDPEKKLRKLYERAQQIRNLSYERKRDEKEIKAEKLKFAENASDVLKRGYGFRNDITRLFAAMARSAGFDITMVAVSSRQEKFFDKGVLSESQLKNEIVLVRLNGKDVYLDPGTPFCPYGLLRWMRTSVMALKLEKKGPTFFQVPAATYKDAVMNRNANMEFSEDGDLKGDIAVQFTGVEALEHRLDALDTDVAGRNKSLEDELASWLPAKATIKVTDSSGWDKSDVDLTVLFHVEISGYASVVGKRLLMPSSLFQIKQKDAFNHADRKYPVYFPYAFSELDTLSLKLPAGYSAESAPPRQQAKLPYAQYEIATRGSGSALVTERVLMVNGIFFESSVYNDVKDFFKKVQTGDEQQVVLRGTATAKAGDM